MVTEIAGQNPQTSKTRTAGHVSGLAFVKVLMMEHLHLLDRLMGFEPGERLTEAAVARICEEAADNSYRKGGMNASISLAEVSKETVMEKLHSLRFPKEE